MRILTYILFWIIIVALFYDQMWSQYVQREFNEFLFLVTYCFSKVSYHPKIS